MSSENVSQTTTPIRRNHSTNLTQDVAASPSSTTFSESGLSASFQQADGLALRAQTSAGFLATRKITIRSDPALLTCFEVADKHLYDLWVPRT